MYLFFVTTAKAGVQSGGRSVGGVWVPAFAGMTETGVGIKCQTHTTSGFRRGVFGLYHRVATGMFTVGR